MFLLSALCGSPCVERVAVFCWPSCAASSFRCFCASCWRSMSVLKKPASVVAKASALTVTVLTCFSSASCFARVFFQGAVEDRLGFCGFLAFFLICDPRLHLRRQPSVLSLTRLVWCASSAPVSGTRPWFAACGPASCVECSRFAHLGSALVWLPLIT